MKSTITIILSLFVFTLCKAQVTVSTSQLATQLVNKIVATSGTLGVSTSNETLTCDSAANAIFSGINNLQINDGILLGSGAVNSGSTLFFNSAAAAFSSKALNTAGDADLNALVTYSTYDACVLEFDLVPVGTSLEFTYVFGSEEYPEFNCSAFNDVFAFLISGPGITGKQNMAIVPGTNDPVSIHSINDSTGFSFPCANVYPTYYVDNFGASSIVMDGFTTPLPATANVVSGQSYHLKLAIADVADQIFDCFVALEANSLKSTGPSTVASVSDYSFKVYPTQMENEIIIDNSKNYEGKMYLYNIAGVQMYQHHLSQGKQQISTHNLASGIYFLHIQDENGRTIYSQKLVK